GRAGDAVHLPDAPPARYLAESGALRSHALPRAAPEPVHLPAVRWRGAALPRDGVRALRDEGRARRGAPPRHAAGRPRAPGARRAAEHHAGAVGGHAGRRRRRRRLTHGGGGGPPRAPPRRGGPGARRLAPCAGVGWVLVFTRRRDVGLL